MSDPSKRAIMPGITTHTSSNDDVSSVISRLVPRTLNLRILPGYTSCKDKAGLYFNNNIIFY